MLLHDKTQNDSQGNAPASQAPSKGFAAANKRYNTTAKSTTLPDDCRCCSDHRPCPSGHYYYRGRTTTCHAASAAAAVAAAASAAAAAAAACGGGGGGGSATRMEQGEQVGVDGCYSSRCRMVGVRARRRAGPTLRGCDTEKMAPSQSHALIIDTRIFARQNDGSISATRVLRVGAPSGWSCPPDELALPGGTPSRWARLPCGHALPVGTHSRWARPPGGHALPVAADEQAQASYLVCIPTDRTALALRVICVGAGRNAVPGLPVATARAPGAVGRALRVTGLRALCAGAGCVAVSVLTVGTARPPSAVGGAICVAGLQALCADAGRVAVRGLRVATARAPSHWAARCVWPSLPRFARAPVALSCRHGMRAENAAPWRPQLVMVAAISVRETRPPAAAGLRLADDVGSA